MFLVVNLSLCYVICIYLPIILIKCIPHELGCLISFIGGTIWDIIGDGTGTWVEFEWLGTEDFLESLTSLGNSNKFKNWITKIKVKRTWR